MYSLQRKQNHHRHLASPSRGSPGGLFPPPVRSRKKQRNIETSEAERRCCFVRFTSTQVIILPFSLSSRSGHGFTRYLAAVRSFVRYTLLTRCFFCPFRGANGFSSPPILCVYRPANFGQTFFCQYLHHPASWSKVHPPNVNAPKMQLRHSRPAQTRSKEAAAGAGATGLFRWKWFEVEVEFGLPLFRNTLLYI